MSYSASLIAFAFVQKGIAERNYVTQMKLQKMVYFAHGYHLAKYGEPLIFEKFEAWKFGPVVPNIYHTYKLYGSGAITDTNLIFDFYTNQNSLLALDIRAKDAIEYTWIVTKGLSANNLSAWSHNNDAPWAKVYMPDKASIQIPDESIKEYFEGFLIKSDGEAA